MRLTPVPNGSRPTRFRRWPGRTVVCAVALLLAPSTPVAAQTAPGTQPLAEVDGQAITAEEVEKALGAQLQRLEEQIFNLKRQKLEATIGERLLAREAAKRGVTVPALLDAEVTSKVTLVTEQEIESFYQAQKTSLRGEEAGIREQIRAHLQSQKLAVQRETFVQSLRSEATVIVHLQAPPVARVEVSTEGAPFKGPVTAPVTIVEFSDFHCPFCKQVLPTLTQLQARYGDKVKLVFRDYPIERVHPGATRAAEAARCAHEQGKFWAYHDKLYTNAPQTSTEELKAYAQDAELDLDTFEKCVASGRYHEGVQKDVEEGTHLGVTGTPTFFVNGREVAGAQPLDRFVQIIEDELARAR